MITMKKYFLTSVLCVLSCIAVAGGLEEFLSNMNMQARADINDFSARISVHFGVPEVQVRSVLSVVSEPADAFMIFQLRYMTQTPLEKVLRIYKSNKGRGWGVIAQELGIKPGTAEFHALKRGDFHFASSFDESPGKSKSHGKGKNKRD
jgi:hypothetical protein